MGSCALQREVKKVHGEEVEGEREGRQREGQPVEEKTHLIGGQRSRK